MPRISIRLMGWLVLIAASLYPTAAMADDDRMAKGLRQAVAMSYGFADWDQVEEIRFTFNTQSARGHSARHWTWRPIEGRVTLEIEGEEPITYLQSDLAGEDVSEELSKTDHRFINDSYWLLFPFYLVWSEQTVTDAGESPLPIGEGTGQKLIVQYPDEGGYTPGDAYDLYIDNAGLITHWVFRRGGGEKGSAMTWESNVDLGPIKVCTDHYSADKSFRLWFDGLGVTTVDGDIVTAK